MPYPPQPYGPFPADAYQSTYGQETPRDLLQGPQLPPMPPAVQPQPVPQPQQQPPSPGRRSMFDFVSPFDALANAGSSSVPKKPVPEVGNVPDDSWPGTAADPKRKSMENLMDQLTRSSQSQGPAPPPQHQLDSYSPEPATPPADPMQYQSKPIYGMSQQQHHLPGSPRGSPPRSYVQQAQGQHRTRESPTGPMAHGQGSKGKTDSSPSRGNWKSNQESRLRAPKTKAFINTP